jgi:hypothetical protein
MLLCSYFIKNEAHPPTSYFTTPFKEEGGLINANAAIILLVAKSIAVVDPIDLPITTIF